MQSNTFTIESACVFVFHRSIYRYISASLQSHDSEYLLFLFMSITETIPHLSIRKARPSDAEAFLSLVDALADFEKLQRPDEAARERLKRDVFGDAPRIEVYFAALGEEIVGYGIILETYSSFLALPTLYLEDIFVLPHYRGQGIGKRLFLALASLAKQRGCGRMEWTVLDWNRHAIDFYTNFGAKHMSEWQLFRLTKKELEELSLNQTVHS